MRISNRTGVVALATLVGIILCVPVAVGDAPKLVRSEPANDAQDVPVDVGVLRLHFDCDMRTDSYTCWKSPQGTFPPPNKDVGSRWSDARTFELAVQKLAPLTEYAVQLNADQRQGFRAADGTPLPVTTIRFKTAGEKATPRQDIYDPTAEPEKPKPRQDVYDPTAEPEKPAERGHMLKCDARVGQVSQMSQTVRFQLTVTASSQGEQETQKIDRLFKLRYTDEHLEVADGRPVRIKRKVQLAQAMMKDQETGEVHTEDVPLAGVEAELRVRPDGTMSLVSVSQGDRTIAEQMAGESQWFTLVPGRAVKVGETWKLEGEQLRNVLDALDATDGEVTMRLDKIEKDPQMNKDVAKLEGRIRGKMQLEGLAAEMEGTMHVDFVPEIGLPFLRKFDATLRVNQVVEAEGEQVRIVGEGRMEAVEERAILGGSDAAPSPPPQSTPWPGDQSQGRRPPVGGSGSDTVAFHRVAEPNEQAFSMLIPRGWLVEGGIVRVDPVSTGAAAQAIAAKLNMVIKSDAAGTVMVHLLPGILYVDNRGAPAAGMFPPGSMMNGMPVAYRVSAAEFLTQMVFPQVHPYAQDVQITEQKSLPELSRAYQQRTAAIPLLGAQFQFDSALVTLEYTENGTRFRERMITLIRDYGQLGAGMWDNLETATFRAPADQFERWEPVTHVMRESVKLNMQWIVGEVRGQLIRSGIHANAQAEAQRIGREIAEHRQKTNAEINNDMYLTLTGQEEYVNPYTNEVERDSGDWRYRWVNESGEIVFTNNEDYNPNIVPDPPFNRTDFKRSPVRPRTP